MSSSSCLASTLHFSRATPICGDYKPRDQDMDSSNLNSFHNVYVPHEALKLLTLLQQQPQLQSNLSANIVGPSPVEPNQDSIPIPSSTEPLQIDVSGLTVLLSSLIGGSPTPCVNLKTNNNGSNPDILLAQVSSLTGTPTLLDAPNSKSSVDTRNCTSAVLTTNLSTSSRASCDKLSSNLLHQLLSGVDATQVRHRSCLIEPTPSPSVSSPLGEMPALLKCEAVDSVTSSIDPIACEKSSSSVDCESGRVSTEASTISEGEATVRQGYAQSYGSTHPTLQSIAMTSGATPFVGCQTVGDLGSSPLSALLTERLWAMVRDLDGLRACQTNGPNPTSLTTLPISPAVVSTHIANKTTTNSIHSSSLPNSSPGLRKLLCQTTPAVTSLTQESTNKATSGDEVTLKDTVGKPAQTHVPNITVDGPLFERYQNRPRSHSDIHNGMHYYRKVQHAHRPRSYSKLDRPLSVHHHHQQDGYTTNLSQEIQSSLFAQLVLNTEAKPPTTRSLNHGSKSRSQDLSTQHSPPDPQPMALDEEKDTSPKIAANTALTVDNETRNRIFEWLREADLFVAEHCRDIPLGALLSVSISPCRTSGIDLYSSLLLSSSIASDGIRCSTKRMLSKIWHQLLLIAMIENRFVSLSTMSQPVNKSHRFPNTSSSTTTDPRQNSLETSQSERDKWLNAITSLMELQLDDAPPPDDHFVKELSGVLSVGAALGLNSDVCRSMRFCILAQNAYPNHFSTSYPEALSELESELSRTPTQGTISFTEVLKLLNRFHCFDAGTLKQFFSLSTDPIQAAFNEHDAIQKSIVIQHPLYSLFSGNNGSDSNAAVTGSFKRKARQPASQGSPDHEHSPVRMRSRAYTTNSYNKSVRLSEKYSHTDKGRIQPKDHI